jgi:hypothetical protein
LRSRASWRPGRPRHFLGSRQPRDSLNSKSIRFEKSLRRRRANFLDRNPKNENFGFATAGASMTDGNPFLPLAISILRLFGNEDRHSQRSPHLHMARVFPV